jgi:hypothetical protein
MLKLKYNYSKTKVQLNYNYKAIALQLNYNYIIAILDASFRIVLTFGDGLESLTGCSLTLLTRVVGAFVFVSRFVVILGTHNNRHILCNVYNVMDDPRSINKEIRALNPLLYL